MQEATAGNRSDANPFYIDDIAASTRPRAPSGSRHRSDVAQRAADRRSPAVRPQRRRLGRLVQHQHTADLLLERDPEPEAGVAWSR